MLCVIPIYSHSYRCHNNTFISILFLSFIILLEEEILQNLGALMINNLINKIGRLDIDDDE